MIVVIDSNVIIKDPKLESNTYKTFVTNAKRLGISLFLSSYVLQEVVNKYGEKLNEVNEMFRKINQIPLLDEYTQFTENKIEVMKSEYKSYILNKLDSDLGNYLKYCPTGLPINIDILFKRALEKKKPFTSSGNGFRDAIIWNDIKNTFETYTFEDSTFAIITSNKHDFTDLKPNGNWFRLAKDLLDELNPNYDLERIRVYTSLSEFNSDFVQSRSQQFTRLLENINGIEKRSTIEVVYSILQRHEEMLLDDEDNLIDIIKVSDFKAIDINSNWTNGDNELIVEAIIETQVLEMKELVEKKFKVFLAYDLNSKEIYELVGFEQNI